jgi:hypothetical protein
MRGRILIQKSFSQFLGGYHAAFFFAKPLIAVSGNDIIDKIPDKFGDDDQPIKQFPSTIQVFANSDSGR